MTCKTATEWKQLPYDAQTARQLYSKLNIGYHTCIVLAQKGIKTQIEAEQYLWPKLIHFDDPSRIENIDATVTKLCEIIADHSSVAIVCDYDVDGITSVTLFVSVLRHFGVFPEIFVPQRTCEGYGLSKEIIQRILKTKTYDYVIALDCGTTSVQEVEILKQNGVSVIIVDHHMSQNGRTPDCCIINPNISTYESASKYSSLCTAGLIFKLCWALLRFLRRQGNKRASEYQIKNDLDLVALGTIADMSNLVGENRIFCKFGLRLLSGTTHRPGIEALLRSIGLKNGSKIEQTDISCKLCPRLNACGRVGDASVAIDLLLSDSIDDALSKAYELDETNKERQLIEREITDQASKVLREQFINDPGFVMYDESWRTGVVGIVSGKFAHKHNKPCIILGYEMGLAKGSGRSAGGPSLIDILSDCSEYLESWGGHPHAVGVAVKLENLDNFRKSFNEAIERRSKDVPTRQETSNVGFTYASEIEINELDESFLEEVEMLQPFGQKNSEPVFLLKNVKIWQLPVVFGMQSTHVKFWLMDRYFKRMLVVGWGLAGKIPPIKVPLDLLVQVKRETWSVFNNIGLSLIDWRVTQR